MERRRRAPWLALIILALGLAVLYGGFDVRADQTSGTPGEAKVTECEGGGKYSPAIRCRGTWEVGGDAVFGDGELAIGRVEGADHGDVGKTIDVRIHGTDHATKPSLGTAIMLWALGGAVSLFALFALWRWWRQPSPSTSSVREGPS